MDRFMLKVIVGYPNHQEELEILKRMSKTKASHDVQSVLGPEDVVTARKLVDQIYVDDRVSSYIVDLVMATREPESYGIDAKHLIQYGGSPRASINLTLAAKANAFLSGRGYVTPQDVKDIAHDVLRHRVILTYEAEAEEISSVDVIDKILSEVRVP